MKIPKTPNEESRLKAANRIADQILKDVDGFEGESRDALAKDIAQYCRFYSDGFKCAKELEQRAYWECDLQTAEILDGYHSAVTLEHDKFLAKWQEENNVQPPFPAGAKVKFGDDLTGTIDQIYKHRALSYTIKVDGDPDAETKNRRQILYFDQVEAA